MKATGSGSRTHHRSERRPDRWFVRRNSHAADKPVLASRVRLGISSVMLGIGVIIAIDQLGVSTNTSLLLVAALAALAGGLAVGLGSLGMSRQVAAGRSVHAIYATVH